MNFDTKCLHAGYRPGNGEPRNIPIIQSTTFRYETCLLYTSFGRVKPDILSCEERRDNFNRVDNSFSEAMAKYEAGRCLKCPLRCQLHKPKMWTAYVK